MYTRKLGLSIGGYNFLLYREAGDGELVRRDAQQEEGSRHRQGGLGGGAVVQRPGELLPVHHLALDGDQLPLEGQPQLPPLPAGQGGRSRS